MTKTSPLKDFSAGSIEDLIDEGVKMRYRRNIRNEGYYHRDKKLVEIRPNPKHLEDITILHEWLHAYEDRILNQEFREAQIDWWAYYHKKNNSMLVDYIRSHFKKKGF